MKSIRMQIPADIYEKLKVHSEQSGHTCAELLSDAVRHLPEAEARIDRKFCALDAFHAIVAQYLALGEAARMQSAYGCSPRLIDAQDMLEQVSKKITTLEKYARHC